MDEPPPPSSPPLGTSDTDTATPIKLSLYPGDSELLAPAYESIVKPLNKQPGFMQKLRDFNWQNDKDKLRQKFYFEYYSKEKFMGMSESVKFCFFFYLNWHEIAFVF